MTYNLQISLSKTQLDALAKFLFDLAKGILLTSVISYNFSYEENLYRSVLFLIFWLMLAILFIGVGLLLFREIDKL